VWPLLPIRTNTLCDESIPAGVSQHSAVADVHVNFEQFLPPKVAVMLGSAIAKFSPCIVTNAYPTVMPLNGESCERTAASYVKSCECVC
jgi:hypothetical protein